MDGGFSYYYGHPRSEVHKSKYGTTDVPPRQYLRGGGRRVGASASTSTGLMGVALLLGLLVLLGRKT